MAGQPVGALTKAADVQARFQSKDTQLFHFACHGNFDATNPDNSMIKLEGGFLNPSQIGVRRAPVCWPRSRSYI